MKISARIENSLSYNRVSLETNGVSHEITIPPGVTGYGSSANGGELLFLALATCYCNDIYREAARRGLSVSSVEVEVYGEFGKEGEPGRNIHYRARVKGPSPEEDLRDLMLETDNLAEIQNTLRAGAGVTLSKAEAICERE
jgi:uncharacterized OsmC-like protein